MRFQTALPQHSPSLLQLLEENAMQGKIEMVMTRRPDYFSNLHYFGAEYPVLAEENGQAVGMCQLTRHNGFVNGQPQQLGYLNSLRISHDYRHRIRILKSGFDYLKQQLTPPQYCYTSIASDNLTARKLLEKESRGLPRYCPLGELSTLAISTQRGRHLGLWQNEAPQQYPEVVAFYHRQAIRYQLTPQLSVEWLINSGLPVWSYRVNGELQACAVLWNQQPFKQVMALGYHSIWRAIRPIYNGYASLTKRVALPPEQQALDQSFLAFFAITDPQYMLSLIDDALSRCTTRVLTLGLASSHPMLKAVIKRFQPLNYKTCLYGVDLVASPPWLQQAIAPEAAIL
ncbi:GNAT family N-acetyltransferase [Budviciaceae bacterium BWR-B9]|uniref:GNAT family N-acetyltransferase n=1 Tax=Limnobaculum allomyrinae TaxID=2791986 RepID=A0ABS1IMH4_9GAMM|nr:MULTISPECIES: GNAT family N-acetyltransferase [Limnobaculum]MBK5142956.1 GNAT family N-acetyltransferase [Limnobaculum allomyrinae]MBV7690157.1 GNAT family N-acetyltransferase [Limnobaculum sp. M2-1]